MFDTLKQMLFPNEPNIFWLHANQNGKYLRNDTPTSVFEKDLSQQISSNTCLVIDNSFEGQFRPWLKKIYDLINSCSLISADRVYYITAAIEGKELHDSYCFENGIQDQINLIIVNTWEKHIKMNSPDISERVYTKEGKDKLFLCFNRILRPHRLGLLGLLSKKDMVSKGYYSFFNAHYFPSGIQKEGTQDMFDSVFNNLVYSIQRKKSLEESNTIIDDISIGLQKLELPIMLNAPCEQNTIGIVPSDEYYFNNSRFSLVTETHFFPEKMNDEFQLYEVFFTEKTYKPILMKHPFILVGAYKSLSYLKTLGYKTFEPYIDESYDNIENSVTRLQMIVEEVERLSKLTADKWAIWEDGVSDIVEHNYRILKERTVEESILWKS